MSEREVERGRERERDIARAVCLSGAMLSLFVESLLETLFHS